MGNENVIPFPAVINPMALMQMPRVTTDLLGKGLIDLDSYKRITDAMATDIAFLHSVANDFFTEQFDADALAGIAGLLRELAETAGHENPLEDELSRASLRLARLAGRLAAMRETAQPC